MLEVRLEPGERPLDLRLPLHRAIRSVLNRYMPAFRTCGCPQPALRILLSEAWRFGGLRILRIEACCDQRRDEALRTMPGIDRSMRKPIGTKGERGG